MEEPTLKQTTNIKPDYDLSSENRAGVINLLSENLGSIYTLAAKTKKYHWNVTGPEFQQLHELFDQQYNILLTMIDDIAEYIRQYGEMSPGTLNEFRELSILNEKDGYNPAAMEMVADLVADYETMIRKFRTDSQKSVDQFDDIQAEDLFIGFMHTLTKQAWFLRAHLE